MRALRVGVATLVVGAAALALLPFVGPALGLDDYQRARRPAGMRVDLPNGHWLNLERLGSGPPVVLVHGLPGDAGQVAELAAELARQGFETLIYDRVGWGWSSRRPADEPARLERHGEELVALVDTLGLGRAVWLGFSYGGGVVQHAAARAPGRARALVLLASVGPTQTRRAPTLVGRMLFSRPVLGLALSTGASARAFSAPAMASLFAPETEPPRVLVDRFLATVAMPGAVDSWLRESRAPRGWPKRPTDLPALVLHGSGDASVSPDVGRDLARRLPAATFELIEGGSHALPLTRPGPVAARIARFIRALPEAPSAVAAP